MSDLRRIVASVAICSFALLGTVSLTSAEPGQKKAGAPSKATIEAGKLVYTANGCAACHKIQGKGGVTSTDLTKIGKKLKPAKIAQVVRKGTKGKTGVVMAPYGPDRIGDKELKQLVAYMQSLK
jgi:mono/diheme cytochrome c family protein